MAIDGLHVGVGALRAVAVDGKNWASGNWHKRVVYNCMCDGDAVDVGQALGGGEQGGRVPMAGGDYFACFEPVFPAR